MLRCGSGFGVPAGRNLGTPVPPPADGAPADTTPMLETFQLGFRNLQEVWSLVLPPVTLLELKRLARPSTERFHMPDELWVRIVYDFALAYRLRTISRSHLLGALTPLYLGWVASYALEVGNASPAEAEQGWRSWLAPMKMASRIYYRGGVGQTASTLRGGGEDYVDSGVAVTARIDGSGHQPHRHAASGNSGVYRGGVVLCRHRVGAGLAGPFVV
jgi:hypothetical protein